MNINPLVSVIIPNYCHARYLDERIQSVLNQTYTHFEVIILDDCSPDDGASKEVIERYRGNPHISQIVYNEQNSGSTFKQWQKGFRLAKGELIWIAESDDKCEPTLLEALVNGFVKYDNVAISYCASLVIDGDGNNKNVPFVGNVAHEFYEGKNFISHEMSWCNGIPNASAVVFKKEVALSVNPQYMNYVAAGDRLFWIELCEKGNVFHSSEPLNYFRKHGDNVTPRCYRNGTTMTEDYHINRYLEKNHYMSIMQILGARCHYQSTIYRGEFDSPEIRKNVMRLWNCHGLLPYSLLFRFLKLYNTLREWW